MHFLIFWHIRATDVAQPHGFLNAVEEERSQTCTINKFNPQTILRLYRADSPTILIKRIQNSAKDMINVAILNTWTPAAFDQAREMIEEANCRVVLGKSFDPKGTHRKYPEAELRDLLGSSDAVLTVGRGVHMPASMFEPAPKDLRGIVCFAIGYDFVDIDACTKQGIIVSNSPDPVNYGGVAQHTVLLILALARGLDFFRDWSRSGKQWGPRDTDVPKFLDENMTLGVVGLGRIGYRVARLFKQNFNATVLTYDPYIPQEKAQQIGIKIVEDLDELLQKSDIVTLHVPLTAETRKFIAERELKLMKKTAYLVNTCRGGVLDEPALIRALEEGRIAGAALDVAESEPMDINNPLLQMKNVIVTPHIAGFSPAHNLSSTAFGVNNAIRLVSGKLPTIVANPITIPKWKERFGIESARYGGVVQYR